MIATPEPTQWHDGYGNRVTVVDDGRERVAYLNGRRLTPETTICLAPEPVKANPFRLVAPSRNPNRAQRRTGKRPTR